MKSYVYEGTELELDVGEVAVICAACGEINVVTDKGTEECFECGEFLDNAREINVADMTEVTDEEE